MSRRHIPLGDRFEVEYVGGFLRVGNDQEVALAPPEAIAAKSRTALAPDLAMLVVAGRKLRQALG
jgi:hypothetical protein